MKELFPLTITLDEWESMSPRDRDTWNAPAREAYAKGDPVEFIQGESHGFTREGEKVNIRPTWRSLEHVRVLLSNEKPCRPRVGDRRNWMARLQEEYALNLVPINTVVTDETWDVIHEAYRRVERDCEQLSPCHCQEECGPDEKCSYCLAVITLEKLRLILEPEATTLNPERLSSYPEAVYFYNWKNEQRDNLLANILSPTRIPPDSRRLGRSYVPPFTARDAQVAATVIQWLGTNIGRCFVEKCEKEIRQANAVRRDMEMGLHREPLGKNQPKPDPVAIAIASELLGGVVRADHPSWAGALDTLARRVQHAGLATSKEVTP